MVKECDEIIEKVGKEKFVEIIVNFVLIGFIVFKILWVRNNEF